jgi:F0F1-type ATP synthase assembly protein I
VTDAQKYCWEISQKGKDKTHIKETRGTTTSMILPQVVIVGIIVGSSVVGLIVGENVGSPEVGLVVGAMVGDML